MFFVLALAAMVVVKHVAKEGKYAQKMIFLKKKKQKEKETSKEILKKRNLKKARSE